MAKKALTQQDVERWVDSGSFARGRTYHRQGRIVDPSIEGETLRARCEGSFPIPYQVSAQVKHGRLVDSSCNCPVGGDGRCKHVVALLLGWIDAPERFVTREPLARRLEALDREALIALLLDVVRHYPEAEELISISAQLDSGDDVDQKAIRAYITRAFRENFHGFDWYESSRAIAPQLEKILSGGRALLAREAWAKATLYYRTVLDEILRHYVFEEDPEGRLAGIIDTVVERLGECLPHLGSPEARAASFDSMLELWIRDVEQGGAGVADLAARLLVDATTPDERARLATRVEVALEQIPADDDNQFFYPWRRAAYGWMLLSLQEDTLDNEGYLDLCRRTGRTGDLVVRLLELERVSEALDAVRSLSDRDLLSLAELFVNMGHEGRIERLIWERAGTSNDRRLDAWLKEYALRHEDWPRALEYTRNVFERMPTLAGYREFKMLADRLGRWPELRGEIMELVEQRPNRSLLIQIHIEEGEIDRALELWDELPSTSGHGLHAPEVWERLVEATRKTRPTVAIRLYREQIDALIGRRQRTFYADAAELMHELRPLVEQEESRESWRAYLDEIRNQKPRLPALRDEMSKAGL